MIKKWGMLAVVILMVCAEISLIIFSEIRENQNLKMQDELLKTIEEGVSEIKIELPEDDTELDYYGDADPSSVTDRNIDEDISSVNGIGIIEIESIDLRLPLVEGVEGAKLKVAPGHVSESAGIGETGNCIIAGHRNYSHGEMFNRLDEVKVGDKIVITLVDGAEHTYQVYGITVIEPGDMKLFDYLGGQKKLTLLTCTPIKKATHRLLVVANLVE